MNITIHHDWTPIIANGLKIVTAASISYILWTTLYRRYQKDQINHLRKKIKLLEAQIEGE